MKARKQGFALLLALVMLLSVTSAFASTSVMAPPPVLTTDLPIVTEPVTLSVFAGQQSICEDLNTNYATKWVEEQPCLLYTSFSPVSDVGADLSTALRWFGSCV